jgi:muconolactone delta-isomerase
VGNESRIGGGHVQYLVTMTTHVPDGVPEATVDDVRGREAARARELAARGHLLRLWRPPLRPGEWRTLGLFAADDEDRLGEVLASMPLRIWRDDQVTPLSPHPNDPPSPTPLRRGATEFLTTFTETIPDGADPGTVDDARAAEARKTRELADQGYLVRLWRLPGQGQALGLWQADDAGRLQGILASLPLGPWLNVETVPLAEHPNDPALTGKPPAAP